MDLKENKTSVTFLQETHWNNTDTERFEVK